MTPDGLPLPQPAWDHLDCQLRALTALRCTDRGVIPEHRDAAELVAIRWRDGLRPAGRRSAGGRCRLVRAADGWVAVHLARRCDEESVAAITEATVAADPPTPPGPWGVLEAWAANRPAAEVVARSLLLDVPTAEVATRWAVADDEQARHRERVGVEHLQPVEPGRPTTARPTVVDFTALWAGPLTAMLLGDLGYEVVGVRSTSRPDPGAVLGTPLYGSLHRHHRFLDADFTNGLPSALHEVLAAASVVLLSARPRGLEPLGMSPEQLQRRWPHLLVVTITAYGFHGPWANRPGFGDDVAASAGAVVWTDGVPGFLGDALADPVTGIAAALRAARAVRAGRCGHLDVAMRDAVAALAPPRHRRSNGGRS